LKKRQLLFLQWQTQNENSGSRCSFFPIVVPIHCCSLVLALFAPLWARAMQIENKYACQYRRAGGWHIMQIEGSERADWVQQQ
jgi:hypothetical protein